MKIFLKTKILLVICLISCLGAIPISKPVYNFPQKTIITQLNDSCIKTIQSGTLGFFNQMETDFLNNTVSEPTAEQEREVGELFHKEILKEYSLLPVPKKVDSIFNKLIIHCARKDIVYKIYLVTTTKIQVSLMPLLFPVVIFTSPKSFWKR